MARNCDQSVQVSIHFDEMVKDESTTSHRIYCDVTAK